jgi:anti-sigma-K factor RskA
MSAAWAGGAAAAGIAIGLVAGYAAWNEPPAPSPVHVASTRLDTISTHQWQGMATLLRDKGLESLSVSAQRLDPGSGYLEVWLINRDGKRMVSLGVLRADGRSTFPVTQQLIDEGYVVVDISREGFDDKPEHSGDSLVRGTLSS